MGRQTLNIFGLALFGLMLTVLFIRPDSPEDGPREGKANVQTAEALEVQAITVVPRMAAYGQARPSKAWAAAAPQDGRLIWISPKVVGGEVVEKGDELLHLIEDGSVAADQTDLPQPTIIRAPFRGLAVVDGLEVGQVVAAGKTMLTLDSADKAEITIGLNSEKLAMLTNDPERPDEDLASEVKNNLSQAWVEVAAEGDTRRLPARLGSKPVAVNPGTGLVEASLVVDNPASPGALHQVFISGPPRASQVVIPRQAVHDGEVFVLDGRKRLKKRPVQVKYTLDNYVVVGQGLRPGETLITGDVSALKPGSLLEVRLDDQFYLTAENELGRKPGEGAANAPAEDKRRYFSGAMWPRPEVGSSAGKLAG